MASGKIKYVGNQNSPDYELVQEIDTEIAFVYTGPSGQTDLVNMLVQLGIPVAVDNEYMEETRMGRMEWTKFLAVFFGYEEEAVSYVEGQLERLAQMEALVAGLDKPGPRRHCVRAGLRAICGQCCALGRGGLYIFLHPRGRQRPDQPGGILHNFG
ncbi:MAG: hypothetical protein FWG10_00665 [Eubacteriaceae bacterium]|nr:hypothetical protein [Eubacteriaceae bacterium]